MYMILFNLRLLFVIAMRSLLAATLLLSIAQVHASSDFTNLSSSADPPGVLRLALNRVQHDKGARRDISLPLKVETGLQLTVSLSIGTPASKVEVLLDSGSSILWVNPDCNTADSAQLCSASGRVGKSSTRKTSPLGGTHLQYGLEAFADVDYYEDVVALGSSAQIRDQTFGIATKTSRCDVGIVGVGPSQFGFREAEDNTFLLNSLKNQGLTKSRAYALDVPSQDSSAGSVVFGGVDTKKFRGELQSVALSDSENGEASSVGYVTTKVFLN